jgi:predicted AAA+ superfamily ATPase
MFHRECKILKDMSFLLLGARGTGKTWLLEEEFRSQAILWINLLKNQDYLRYQSKPATLRQELTERTKQSNGDRSWVIIDEVQRVPQLLNEVQDIIEDRELGSKVSFGLSGSSARKLKRGGANLLAGRALLNNLYPLLATEIGSNFKLDEVLSWGALPAIVKQPNPDVRREQLETYVAVYLREEIREEQIVRNLDPFTRFLEVAAQTSGQIVNYSSIGRDCNIDSRMVARYFEILEETLLGQFLLPYHRSIRKQQRTSPKFYFFDLGVMRALEGTLAMQITRSSYGYGRLFEHFFIWEVIKRNNYSRSRYKLSYLITKQAEEIDLIVERKGKSDILIEIKSGSDPHLVDAKNLIRLQSDFSNSEIWVVSQTENPRQEQGVRFLNWRSALLELFE